MERVIVGADDVHVGAGAGHLQQFTERHAERLRNAHGDSERRVRLLALDLAEH